jgi:hypothetical protein
MFERAAAPTFVASHGIVWVKDDGTLWFTDGAGVDDQIAYSTSPLSGIADLDGDFLVGTGSGWVVESGTTVRASLGLGTLDTATFGDLALSNSGGVISFNSGDVTITHGPNQLNFQLATNGYAFADGPVRPLSAGAITLGTASFGWGDLFIASTGTINFDNGDIVITHSTNVLAFSGALNGYSFDKVVKPATNGGSGLGNIAFGWADLHMTSGGVINWSNGDVTITHSANALAFAGATGGYSFDDVLTTEAVKRAVQVYTSATATLLISAADHIVVINRATADAMVVTLPAATGSGKEIVVKRHVNDSSTGLNLDGGGGDTIDGQASIDYVDAANGPSATLIDSASGEWIII